MANANESIISGLNDHNGIICFRGLGPYLKFLVSVVDLGKINGSLPVEQWKVQTIIIPIFVLWVYVDVVTSFVTIFVINLTLHFFLHISYFLSFSFRLPSPSFRSGSHM